MPPDPADRTSTNRARSAKQYPLAIRSRHAPALAGSIERGVVLSKRPRQRPMKDIPTRHVQGPLDIKRGLGLDARPPLRVAKQQPLDRLGKHRVERVDDGALEPLALRIVILHRDEAVRHVQAEDGQGVGSRGDQVRPQDGRVC